MKSLHPNFEVIMNVNRFYSYLLNHCYTFVIILSPINRTGLETIEKLSSTLDFTDYSSQIIHAVVEVLGNHYVLDCFVNIIIITI